MCNCLLSLLHRLEHQVKPRSAAAHCDNAAASRSQPQMQKLR